MQSNENRLYPLYSAILISLEGKAPFRIGSSIGCINFLMNLLRVSMANYKIYIFNNVDNYAMFCERMSLCIH